MSAIFLVSILGNNNIFGLYVWYKSEEIHHFRSIFVANLGVPHLVRRLSVALAPLREQRLVEALRCTGAGKAVNRYSRAEDQEVRRLAGFPGVVWLVVTGKP